MLDLAGNENLITLDCGKNPLKNVVLSTNKNLKELLCKGAGLTALDLSHNGAVVYLDCSENRLAALDLSNLGQLSYLDCSHNNLAALNLIQNNSVKNIGLFGNKLSACEIDNLFHQLPVQHAEPGKIFLKYDEISLPGTDGCREYIATGKNWQVLLIFLEPCGDQSHGHHYHLIPREINNTGNYTCSE